MNLNEALQAIKALEQALESESRELQALRKSQKAFYSIKEDYQKELKFSNEHVKFLKGVIETFDKLIDLKQREY